MTNGNFDKERQVNDALPKPSFNRTIREKGVPGLTLLTEGIHVQQ